GDVMGLGHLPPSRRSSLALSITASRVRETRSAASIPRSGGGEREKLRQRGLDALGHDAEVWQRVVVAEQPEADLAVVGHDRDRERALPREERDREDLRQPPAE